MPSPADVHEPGLRLCDLSFSAGYREDEIPSVEPSGRGGFVDSRRRCDAESLPPVLPRVEQYVRERVPHLARRAQQVEVVPPVENGACARKHAVDRACEPRANGLHPARESSLRIGLDEEMRVIALQGVVQDAEVTALASDAQAPLELPHQRSRTKARKPTANPQRDVCRAGAREPAARAMLHARSRRRRPTRTLARSAPPRAQPKLIEGELRGESLTHAARLRYRRIKVKKKY